MKKCFFFTLLSVCLLGFVNQADAQSKAECFKMQSARVVKEIRVEKTFPAERGTTELEIFDGVDVAYGLSVTMDINRLADNFLVRVLLIDKEGHKHLVAESYREIAPEGKDLRLTDYCEETALLGGVDPVSLQVIADNAEVTLHSLSIATEGSREQTPRSEEFRKQTASLRRQQVEEKVSQINIYNKAHKKLWVAGPTSVSLMGYEDKTKMMNATAETNLGGFEYYAGGIFEIGDATEARKMQLTSRQASSPTALTSANTAIPITSFDWRNRHGKNWMTGVRDQGQTPYCVAFAIAGCVEAMRNLYYNIPDTTHLSVQQLACCSFVSETPDSQVCVPYYDALNYCKNTGLMLETDYPFVISETEPQICHSDEKTPSENVKITSSHFIYNGSEATIKITLMQHGPLVASIGLIGEEGHSMVLTGFGTVEEGLNYIDFPYSGWNPLYDFHGIIESGDARIGSTYWTFKNSWGTQFGENGYCHIIFNDSPHIFSLDYIDCPITTQYLTSDDVLCNDADGDGYYFWGLGSRPSVVPSWAANYEDMDDTDPNVGGLLTYNTFEYINPDHLDSVYVNYTNYTTVGPYSHNHIVINSGGSFLVNRDYNFCNGAKVIVKSGGELIIRNGAILRNGNIEIRPGGKLSILEGGTLRMMQGKSFEAPVGAIVEIGNGSIEPFSV